MHRAARLFWAQEEASGGMAKHVEHTLEYPYSDRGTTCENSGVALRAIGP